MDQPGPAGPEVAKTNIPGVDFVVSAEDMLACGVNEHLKDVVSVACFDINQSLNEVHAAAKPDHQSVIALLATLTTSAF